MTATRAWAQKEKNGGLVLCEFDLPEPGPHQVVVRVISSGVCHTQLWEMTLDRDGPLLLGHEGYGIVVATGGKVTTVAEGDHVLLTWLPGPGAAERAPQPVRVDLGGGTLGAPVKVFTWAEHTLADELYVKKLSGPVTEAAAVVGCAVFTGAGAALNEARMQPGERIAVFGTGGVGLSAIAAARIGGAERIVAIDLSDAKLALARDFGATDLVNAAREDPVARILDLLPGRCLCCNPGADVAIDCVGASTVTRQALESVRVSTRGVETGGRCLVIGVPEKPLLLDIRGMLHDNKTLMASSGGSSGHGDLDRILGWCDEGGFDLERLVTDRFAFVETPEAVECLRRGEIRGRAIISIQGMPVH